MPVGNSWFLEGWGTGHGSPWLVAVSPLPFRIGRRPDLELPLSSALVSKLHAEIFSADGRLFVRDHGSTNGTIVNLEPIDSPQPIDNGDLIFFADQECRLVSVPWDEALRSTVEADMTEVRRLENMAPRMREMLQTRAVTALFQPVVEASGVIMGYELLGRGDFQGLPTGPLELFAIAEKMDLEVQLSSALRAEGLGQIQHLDWRPRFFLNTHPREVADPETLLRSLQEIRSLYPDAALVLEIHEMAVADLEDFRQFRDGLGELSIQLAFDDFGAGRARFLELAELAPQFVKFDRRLIEHLHEASAKRRELTRSLIRMVSDLGVATIAEGIESADEAEVCQELGFDFAQGFFFGRPIQASEIASRPI